MSAAVPPILHVLRYAWRKLAGFGSNILIATLEAPGGVRCVDAHQLNEEIPFGELRVFQLGITTRLDATSALTNCKGKLSLNSLSDEKEYAFSSTLCWGREEGPVTTINKDDTEWLNFLTVDIEEKGVLWFPTAQGVTSRCAGIVSDRGNGRSSERPVKELSIKTISEMETMSIDLQVTAEKAELLRVTASFVEKSSEGYKVIPRFYNNRERLWATPIEEEFGGEEYFHIGYKSGE